MYNLFKAVRILLCSFVVFGCAQKQPQQVALNGTPIVGDLNMRNASIWMQLSNSGRDVSVAVMDSTGNSFGEFGIENRGLSNNCLSRITDLEPGQRYTYVVQNNGRSISDTLSLITQPLWQYRTDPPTVKLALGSCTYINEPAYDRPGKPYGGGYEIFTSIASESFDAMLWLGDNVYMREADFGSLSGYIHRYNDTRKTPEIQELLQHGAHYAIWDDHDFGPNDCDGSYIHKDWAKVAFDSFWPNPEGHIQNAPELNATAFKMGDADVFLLDNRTHRVNHKLGAERRQMLGDVQLNWLINNLKNSRAPFKLVAIGGQMVSDAAIYENFAQFPEEREWLFSELNRLKIRGVVFLTGDRHNSELSKIQLENGNWVYDLTVSPLTSGSYDHSEEPNNMRVAGTMVGDRNYGILEITGPRKERSLRMTVKAADGTDIWSRSIAAAEGYEIAL